MHELNGRRVLVTGAGSGIGAAIATAVVASGGSVAVNDLDPDKAAATARRLRSTSVTAVAVPGDVSDEEQAESIVSAAADGLGGLDGLVNNAGIVTRNRLETTSLEEWERVLRVNTSSQFLCGRAARRHLHGGGSIVNVASITGAHPGPRTPSYSVSKAAVISLTQVMSLEWGPAGIRVNAIAPGAIRTEMSSANTDDRRHALGSMLPLGRVGSPEDVAAVAVFLLSDAAAYVTGTVIPVDGGWSVALMAMTARPEDVPGYR